MSVSSLDCKFPEYKFKIPWITFLLLLTPSFPASITRLKQECWIMLAVKRGVTRSWGTHTEQFSGSCMVFLQELDRTAWMLYPCGKYTKTIKHSLSYLFMSAHPTLLAVFLFFFFFPFYLAQSPSAEPVFPYLSGFLLPVINMKMRHYLCLLCIILCPGQK